MVEKLAAQPVVVFVPGGPARQRVVQRDDPLALLEQGAEAGLKLGCRLSVNRRPGFGLEVETGHVVKHQHIEPAHAVRVHQHGRRWLIDHRRGNPGHVAEHAVERAAIKRMPAHRDQTLQRGAMPDDRHQSATRTMTLPILPPLSIRS